MNEKGLDLQRHAMDSWQVIRNRFGLIALSFLLIFATAAILTYIMPRKFRGRVEMKIERMANKLPVFQSSTPDSMAFTDVFVKTEFETITKMETLYPVVDELDLVKKWESPSRQSALARLKGNLDTQSSVRSDFVVIEFYDPDPALAAAVANAVADSYMTRRVEVDSQQKEEALAMVEKQIAGQEMIRDKARLRMQEAKKAAGIVGDWFSGGASSRAPGSEIRTTEENMQMSRQQALLEADLMVQELQAQIDQLATLNADQLVAQASGLGFQNSNVLSMQAAVQELMIQREGLVQGGLGARHPNVISLDAQITTSKEQILGAAQAHLAGLKSQLSATITKRDALKDFNETSKEDILNQSANYNDYKIAKDEVEQIEELLLKLKERYFEERASMELVKSPATIYATAEPELRPSKPNVTLNLALGGIMGLMFGLGLAFVLEYMDTTVKSLDDVEKYLGVPVLAVVPKDVGVLHQTSGFNPDAEAYRILRTNIEFNRLEPNANCITVVSGGAGEGKSTTLANLAYVCAQGGYNVLLIDGDLRRPRMHALFDQLPDESSHDGGRGGAHAGGKSLLPPQRHAPGRQCGHPQQPADERARCRSEVAL